MPTPRNFDNLGFQPAPHRLVSKQMPNLALKRTLNHALNRALTLAGLWLLLSAACAPAQAAPPAAPKPPAEAAAPATLKLQDDEGRSIELPQPARRIVSLAPHATELLFAAGAGAQVVATVRFSNYPEAATRLPLVGDALMLDMERLAALKPDLMVAWQQGTPQAQLERLKALKVPIFFSGAHRLDEVGRSLRSLGRAAGTEVQADAAARAYEQELAGLRQRYAGRPPLRVFYQLWHQPLMTVNRQHLIHDVLATCGGQNLFAQHSALVPTVSQEAVLAARPQVLVTSSPDDRPKAAATEALAVWQGLRHFEPTARGAAEGLADSRIIVLNADHISRPTPRILLAAGKLCEGLERVRARGPGGR